MLRLLPALGLVAAAVLAGCLAPSPSTPSLQVRPTTSDSVAAFTVDSAHALTYADLLVIANERPYRHGPAESHAEGIYEVQGKSRASDPVAFGDVIRIPLTGKIEVELRHAATGQTLQQFSLDVADHTPPGKVALASPQQAASGVDRQARFEWASVSDASGVTYQLEYWPKAPAGGNTPPKAVTGLQASSFAVSPSDRLLPAQTYAWHVRALDGMGNVGAWSDTWEFTTGL